MDWGFVETLRRAELGIAVREIAARKPAGASVVEIGGGSGWQAQMLAEAGYKVRSFDLAGTEYSDRRVFPVEDYDGSLLPAPDRPSMWSSPPTCSSTLRMCVLSSPSSCAC